LGRRRVAQRFSLGFGVTSGRTRPEIPGELGASRGEILAGLAQFAPDVLPGSPELFARFPSCTAELFMGSPDLGPGPGRNGDDSRNPLWGE